MKQEVAIVGLDLAKNAFQARCRRTSVSAGRCS